MLSIRNVTKSYNRDRVKAVDCLSLEVRPGEIFGFIGPNGAGKTTTLKMTVGLLNPDEGSITVNGFDIQKNPIEAKSTIGYVPDSHDVYERLTGFEYLSFMADVYRVSADVGKQRMADLLETFDLTGSAGELIKSYSHGMKQKIAVIGALIHDPALWVLDEPLLGLDPRSAHTLKEMMRMHCDKGNAVFFSTHILEVAEKLCDRVAIINKGKIIAVGTIDELRQGEQAASLEEIFLELTEK